MVIFLSIFEFAAKLAGVSEEQMRLTLNLEKTFQEMPALHEALVNVEISVNKLGMVASIANQENQEFLADQSKLLPQAALETLVRDEKSLRAHSNPSQIEENATGRFSNECNIRKSAFAELNLSDEVAEKLLELQKKGIDINALLLVRETIIRNSSLRSAKNTMRLRIALT